MSTFIPTQGVIAQLERFDQSWPEIVTDLQQATITPAYGYETRQRLCGERYEAFVEPGVYDGHEARWVIYLRKRRHATEPTPLGQQIVGRDARRPTQRKRGGSGRRWPTTWQELQKRILACPGTELRPGGKHLNVYLNGQQVQALPLSASDHRALLNACQALRAKGIDVAR